MKIQTAKSIKIIASVIVVLLVGFLLFTIPHSVKTSNEAYSGKLILSEVDMKSYYQKLLTDTPINQIIPDISIWIIHQYAEDDSNNYRKYRTTFFTFEKTIGGGAKEFYFADNSRYNYTSPSRFFLGYRYERQNYLIELTPQQQRELVTKLIEINFFELDDIMDIDVLARVRRGKPNYLKMDLSNKEFYAIQTNLLVYADTTAKNKAVIMLYKNWLDSKYKTELLKHPVDKWPED